MSSKKYTIKPSDVFVKITDIGRIHKPNKPGSTSKFLVAFSTLEKRGGKPSDFRCVICVDPVENGQYRKRTVITSTEIYVVNPRDLFSDEGLFEINHRAVLEFIRCPKSETQFRHVSRKFIRQLRKVGISYQEWAKSCQKQN